MVVTPIMWKSVENTSRFPFIWKCPVQFDRSLRTAVYHPISKQLIPWCLVLLKSVTSAFPCLFLITSQFFGRIHIEFVNLFGLWMCYILLAIGIVGELALLIYGKTPSVAFSSIKILERRLAWNMITPQKTRSSIDSAGLMLIVIVFVFAFYGCVIIPATTYFRLDPYSQFYHKILLNTQYDTLPARIILLTLNATLMLPAIQTCRVFSIVVTILTVLSRLILDCVAHLDRMTQVCREDDEMESIIRQYQALQIILIMGDELISLGILLFMIVGFVAAVAFIFASVKLSHLIPLPIFIYILSVAAIVPVMIQIMLPMFIAIFENASAFRDRGRQQLVFMANRKYIRRKLESMRIIRMQAGLFGFNVFLLKKAAKSVYYYNICNYTINTMLSVKLS
ncbi:hypothetical protein Fcan01_20479 [Folsomia candida]|uniref:Odorant receptor n=1 Tax=Folsomia candida TaxID=158441 RepID=A0A226DGU2_FOLCA|nr:hypothetical protein Fcan01_20479 [Folsomia candida]